jgi:predicted AlkP superfamily pyrophosphatase or phosphodiesterase
MATGISPERNGVDVWENRTLLVPDAVGSALQQNTSAAWVDGPSPPVSLTAGMVSVSDTNGDGSTDDEVAARALAEHMSGRRLLYVHLSDMDRALHATGPYSAASRDAAVRTDALTGRLVSGAKPGTLIIVTADHGGHDIAGGQGDHGSLLPDDMLVPIFVCAI